MGRLLLFWKGFLLRDWLGAVFCLLGVAFAVLKGGYWSLLALACTLCFASLYSALVVQLWRFTRSTRHFRMRFDKQVRLRYSPTVADKIDLEGYLEACKKSLEELTGLFNLRLPRAVAVYLFDSPAQIDHILGVVRQCSPPPAGEALVGGEIVLVAVDAGQSTIEETTHHEFIHLFAHYLSSDGPPFKDEGLAVWLESVAEGHDIDFETLVFLLIGPDYPLTWLWRPDLFFHGQIGRTNYAIAGSFTGYLIRSYGWERYRRFFCLAKPGNLERAFTEAFEGTFVAAERDWRQQLMAKRQSHEPDLSREVAERRLEKPESS